MKKYNHDPVCKTYMVDWCWIGNPNYKYPSEPKDNDDLTAPMRFFKDLQKDEIIKPIFESKHEFIT